MQDIQWGSTCLPIMCSHGIKGELKNTKNGMNSCGRYPLKEQSVFCPWKTSCFFQDMQGCFHVPLLLLYIELYLLRNRQTMFLNGKSW